MKHPMRCISPLLLGLVLGGVGWAQTFNLVLSGFEYPWGTSPGFESLVQSPAGNFYGTLSDAGVGHHGTVFELTPQGEIRDIHTFQSVDGSTPDGSVTLTASGKIYGSALYGTPAQCGVIFEIDPAVYPAPAYTELHQFTCADGQYPYDGLTQAFNLSFYGTTSLGGPSGSGTIFQITGSGDFTTIYAFKWPVNPPNAAWGQLTLGANGLLYGITPSGGAHNLGAIYSISTAGDFHVLHSFDGSDGQTPGSAPIQASDSNLYGTTFAGGANSDGTIYRLAPDGTLTTLHAFDGSDGSAVYAPLIQATDGNFYGTASAGGASNVGTVFQITPAGVFTTLHSFDNSDGAVPLSGLLQSTDGDLYGMTSRGGILTGQGVVFKISMGLAPFVKPVPWFGAPGANVLILGNNLTGTTSVTFNGVPAAFEVRSGTAIQATVPSAASGLIQVVTPGATLTSNTRFVVLPSE